MLDPACEVIPVREMLIRGFNEESISDCKTIAVSSAGLFHENDGHHPDRLLALVSFYFCSNKIAILSTNKSLSIFSSSVFAQILVARVRSRRSYYSNSCLVSSACALASLIVANFCASWVNSSSVSLSYWHN